ncbi:GntR family transcriptional regulator [Gluconobacter thailandicus NBRC 3257]|uniref:GntR family transcriptional regulator n=1 Tax=Gluconobacter thailandicus NBRC 3257 TaxID=1381097 RepID=A0ABQ0J0Q6_GLUTH|nr:GntR family transcriptional regulator [Gluconobacter thailandicus NBRC 3255]GAD28047.1 GntR family transcriptional regulator [Gluconobacter thailandicus NBRC 3257]
MENSHDCPSEGDGLKIFSGSRIDMLKLSTASSQPLVAQIVTQIAERIRTGDWPEGMRLPSIRRLSADSGVSPLTVSNAYNRLVADGLLEARRASGYFVTRQEDSGRMLPQRTVATSVDSLWLLQRAYESAPNHIQAGCGWLPDSYLFGSGVKQALSSLGRKSEQMGLGYGNPYGHEGLREQICLMLSRQGIACNTSSIIMTHGASQALELAVRCLTQSGDTIFVEDPGYCNLFPALQALRLNIVGIPRLQDGPCLETLQKLAQTKAPKVFIINTRLHNPTGTSCSAPVLHQVLKLAELYGFTLIEDDIFGDLAAEKTPTLAYLGRLDQVIRVSSFSKTISPGLRVGYVACSPSMAHHILKLKMASSLTSNGISEAIVHHILADGRYRLHLARLREALSELQKSAGKKFQKCGLVPFGKPEGGMFCWMRFPHDIDLLTLTQEAALAGIMLAPGSYFSPDNAPSPWLRFNITHTNSPRLFSFLNQRVFQKL